MRIVIAGAHGQVARRLGRLLSARGDTVVGIVRNAEHEGDLRDDGVEPAVLARGAHRCGPAPQPRGGGEPGATRGSSPPCWTSSPLRSTRWRAWSAEPTRW